jgi:hypothetical protein
VSFVAWHRPLRDRPRRYLLVSVGTIFRTDTTRVATIAAHTVPRLPRPRLPKPAAATAAHAVHPRPSPPDPECEPTHTLAPWLRSHQNRARRAGSVTTLHHWPWRRRCRRASAKGRDGRARHAPPALGINGRAPPSLDSSWPPEAPRVAALWFNGARWRKSGVVTLGFGAARSSRGGDTSRRPFFFAILFLSRGSVGEMGWVGPACRHAMSWLRRQNTVLPGDVALTRCLGRDFVVLPPYPLPKT